MHYALSGWSNFFDHLINIFCSYNLGALLDLLNFLSLHLSDKSCHFYSVFYHYHVSWKYLEQSEDIQ